MVLHSLEVRLRSIEELEESFHRSIPDTVDTVTFAVEEELLEDIGAYDLIDIAEEAGVAISSVRVLRGSPTREGLEKLALMASETLMRTVVLAYTPGMDLDELFDVFSVNKARVLIDTAPGQVGDAYSRIRGYIGGVLGLSLTEEKFRDSSEFIGVLDKYLRVVHAVSLTNMDESGRGAPLLKPSKFNNPAVIRFLLERGYDDEVSVRVLEPISPVDEYRVFREYARSVEEKILGRSPVFIRRRSLHL